MRISAVRGVTSNLMNSCFDKWARIIIRWDKLVCLSFLVIYIFISKTSSCLINAFRLQHQAVFRMGLTRAISNLDSYGKSSMNGLTKIFIFRGTSLCKIKESC